MSHYIKTAKVRICIVKGVWDSLWSKVLYLIWSVQKYTWGNICLIPDLAVVVCADISNCLVFVWHKVYSQFKQHQSEQKWFVCFWKERIFYSNNANLINMVWKIDFNSENILELSIFTEAFWTDTHKKRGSKSGVTYSPSNRVKLLHRSEKKGLCFKFLLSDGGCLLLQLTAVTTLGYLQKKM